MRANWQTFPPTQEPRAGWLSRLVGRFRSFDKTSRCTQSGGSLSPIIHEYAVRSGHPMTRTISAAPTRLHWLTKFMDRAKEKLHNVQEKTCDALHTVQCEGMKHTARIESEKKVAIAAAAMKRAEMGTDESAYLATVAAWKSSIAELVAAEMAHPTARESARRANNIRLENMGLVA